MTAEHGTWTNAPTSYAYHWLRCGGSPTVCTTITGTDAEDNDTTYTLTEDDAGDRIRVNVTAANPFGSASALSLRTAAVIA